MCWSFYIVTYDTEASVAGASLRGVVSAIGYAAAGCRVVPASASDNSLFSDSRSFRVEGLVPVVCSVPVIAPFPYVSAHIIDIQLVWLQLSYRMGGSAVIPCNTLNQIASGVFSA